MGIFVNDKAWNLKKAKECYEWEAWHQKRANEALRQGNMSAAKDHTYRAKSYRKDGDNYVYVAKKCTK